MSGVEGSGGRQPPADVLSVLRNGIVARLMPLLRDALDAALRELDGLASAHPPSSALVEDRTDIVLLLREALAYERRWQEQLDATLRGWPSQVSKDGGAFRLMGESDLQVQLVGAPVIDALERRFDDAIDLLDRRLYTVAACMGARERPRNPFSPRALSESFLRAFTVLDASARVHTLVLRHFARLASERLGAVYHWCNATLAEAGYELSSGNEGVLVPGLSPELAQGRAGAGARAATGDPAALPVDALRVRLMQLRRPPGHDDPPRREMRAEELLAVIALLHAGKPQDDGLDGAGLAEALRMRLERVAAGIGLAPGSVALSPQHDAAIEGVGRLLDALVADSALSPAAARAMRRLSLPLLRIAMDTPDLFDDHAHPALRLLGWLVEAWDGNPRSNDAERAWSRIADQAAADFAAEPQPDAALAARLLARVESEAEPFQRRAEMASRRLWQSLQGKERLEAARHQADRQLARVFDAGPLPPVLAAFLSQHWRQWLAHTWLREGTASTRHAEAVALGDRLVAIDHERQGHRIAQALLELEPQVRECLAAGGLEGEGVAGEWSALIAEYADPDRARAPRDVEPLSSEQVELLRDAPDDGIGAGDRLLRRGGDGILQALRVAWRSPLTGAILLVDAQGAREAVLGPRALQDALDAGSLVHRRGGDRVQSALAALARVLQSAQG